MNISLAGRHVELTEPIKQHLNSSIETLKKFHLDIISVTAVASANERKGKMGVSVEFTINLASKNSVVIKQNETDLYAAIDIAIDRAQKALRRMHDRDVDHHKVGINEIKAQANGHIDIHEEAQKEEDEIVPVELELYKNTILEHRLLLKASAVDRITLEVGNEVLHKVSAGLINGKIVSPHHVMV